MKLSVKQTVDDHTVEMACETEEMERVTLEYSPGKSNCCIVSVFRKKGKPLVSLPTSLSQAQRIFETFVDGLAPRDSNVRQPSVSVETWS